MPKKQVLSEMKTVVVVDHWEVLMVGEELTFDCFHQYIATSWEGAVQYVKETLGDPYSWFSAQEYKVDNDMPWKAPIRFFSYKGKEIKGQPIKRCMKAWMKEYQRAFVIGNASLDSNVCPLASYRKEFGL